MMNSPSPAQEDNLRRLLDQRAGRADIHHARIPSLTEFSDSPSIYSHAHFSPRPPHLDSSPPQFDFAIPPQYVRPSLEAVRSFSPSAIGIRELGTDDATPTTNIHREWSTSPESTLPDDEESDPRLSFLGPTMRFHSPAPWETEELITAGGEQEDDARSFVTKRSRSKTRGDGFIKSFGRTAPARATSAARPSLESTNGREKNSIESQLAHAALRALPQAATSTTSSSRPSRPGLVFARSRARTVSSLASPDTSIPPPLHVSPGLVPGFIHTPATSPAPTRSTSPSLSMYSSTLNPTDTTDASRPTSPQSSCGPSDFIHPYANPDLAYDAGPVHAATSFLPPSSLGRHTVFPSDSAGTMSESMATQSSSTLTPDTSMSSVTDYHADVLLKKVVGSVQGKVISSPLSAIAGHQGQKPGSQPGQDKGQLALPGQVPGWSDLSVSPTFNLISLQEAQAQARGRSRTHTQAAPDAPPSRVDPATSSGNVVRLRTRTASAGSKTKTQPLVISNPLPLPRLSTEDTPAAQLGNAASLPRSLKQKKSGFMRLFNGKEKDKPSTPSPPPVPPAPAPSLPRTPKISSARVPVPSLSPSLVPQSPLQLDGIIRSDGGGNDSTEDLSYEGSIKQHGPPLSIVTQGAASGVSSGGSPTTRPGIRSAPPSTSEVASDLGLAPASAPPLTTTFSGLSLRPISTVFSAHFADHIVSADSASSAQSDAPSTPSHSPPSPTSAQSTHDENHVVEDDPYMVIQRLQEQIKSTRKAWQHQIWELEGQVRDLRAEIDAMRLQELRGERCLLCGRSEEPGQGARETLKPRGPRPGVVDRPRARTGVGTRFGAAT
ncbi:hypothetical protein BJV78DRAFT_48836 [Lactifluus subvellereus]|nr:hypothetical protein BJV78DRAFT_48836 [Lactifluus subvellereus]